MGPGCTAYETVGRGATLLRVVGAEVDRGRDQARHVDGTEHGHHGFGSGIIDHSAGCPHPETGRLMTDLLRLSDYDFELLIRDLLGEELQVTFESFARGRDKGVDLRYLAPSPVQSRRPSAPSHPDIVVQCKHYAKTGLSGLKSKLKSDEKDKVAKLSPLRYILATSVDLTLDNKAAIRAIMAPYIVSDNDVLGASDIGALLLKHPKVERSHYKLWLTSSAVLDRFLNSDIYQQTEHVLRNVEKNAVRYVQNRSFPDALNLLTQTHVCVIAGPPGIGKTTLAEMLLLDYIARNYQPVVVSQDASEANRLWNPDPAVPQIFYYDDFLGQAANADKLGKNEDDRISLLISRVTETKNKRLILTTREYILEQAKQDYERLARSNIDALKRVIRLEDYTRLDRAKILYNHLYFSQLAPDVRRSLVPGKTYLKIVEHANYTPRLIDDISRRAFMDGVTAEGFPSYFLAILDDPKSLWGQTFDRSISSEARLVLLSLASLPTTTTLEALKQVYANLQLDGMSKPFHYALKEVDGDFLKTLLANKITIVSFSNPSVREFVLDRLMNNIPLRDRLLSSAPFFEQLLSLRSQFPFIFSGDAFRNALMKSYASDGCMVSTYGQPPSLSYALSAQSAVSRLDEIISLSDAEPPPLEWLLGRCEKMIAAWSAGTFVDQGKMLGLVSSVRSLDMAISQRMIAAVKVGVCVRDMEDMEDADFAMDFLREHRDLFDEEELEALSERASSFVDSELENLLELKDPDEIRSGLEQVQGVADAFGIGVSSAETSRVEEYISDLEDSYNEAEEWDERSGDYSPARDSGDAAIDDLFDSLEN